MKWKNRLESTLLTCLTTCLFAGAVVAEGAVSKAEAEAKKATDEALRCYEGLKYIAGYGPDFGNVADEKALWHPNTFTLLQGKSRMGEGFFDVFYAFSNRSEVTEFHIPRQLRGTPLTLKAPRPGLKKSFDLEYAAGGSFFPHVMQYDDKNDVYRLHPKSESGPSKELEGTAVPFGEKLHKEVIEQVAKKIQRLIDQRMENTFGDTQRRDYLRSIQGRLRDYCYAGLESVLNDPLVAKIREIAGSATDRYLIPLEQGRPSARRTPEKIAAPLDHGP